MQRRAIPGLLIDIARIDELLASPIESVQVWDEIGSRTQFLDLVQLRAELRKPPSG